MRTLLLVAVLFAVVGGVNAAVTLDDPFPGAANSVTAIWGFDSPTPFMAPILPEDYETPAGVGMPTALVLGDPIEMDYLPVEPHSGREGVWKTEGRIELMIDNTDVTGPGTYKDIVVQMIFDSAPMPADDRVWLRYSADGGPVSAGQEPDEVIALGDGYSYARWNLHLEPNPTEEIIYLLPYYCNLYVDEIRVDTVCVPEPATMGMLGLGGVFGLLRRRKK